MTTHTTEMMMSGEAFAAEAQRTADAERRTARRLEIGHAIHQGDVYVHRVADDHPRGPAQGTRQVAVGQTVGARHIAEGPVQVCAGVALPPGVVAPTWTTPEALLGPVVVASGPWTLTHPEHAHHALPAGTYQVTYQADYQTQRRVLD